MKTLNKNDEAVLDLIKSYDEPFQLTNFEMALKLKLSIGQITTALAKLKRLNLINNTTIRTYNNFWLTRRTITPTNNEEY